MKRTKRGPSIATGVIIKNDQGEIFLGKSIHYSGRWIIPEGHLKYGETLEDCVRREIMEELGIKLKNLRFLRFQELICSPDYQKNPKNILFL